MVEGVAVTPDSEFAHASLLARARPKDRHRAGLRLARAKQRTAQRPMPSKAIASFADASVRVSDGGGSPPTFTVAMLALTPDAVDVHPFSVALLDVARVAAGLGYFSGASGAACDAMLVDVTVRRVHKSQYITAAPLSRRPIPNPAQWDGGRRDVPVPGVLFDRRRRLRALRASASMAGAAPAADPPSREAFPSFRVWSQKSSSDQARLDLRNAGLGSVKRIRVRVHGVGAQSELVTVRGGRTQDEFAVASSLELDRRLR